MKILFLQNKISKETHGFMMQTLNDNICNIQQWRTGVSTKRVEILKSKMELGLEDFQ